MAEYRAPLEEMRFLINDVFQMPSLWQTLDGLAEVDRDTSEAILEEAAKISEQVIAPLDREADEEGCRWEDGNVYSPKGFKEAYQLFCDGGWGGLAGNPEYDGMGMPKTLVAIIEEMVQGASMSFGLAPMLTAGACLAINAHASDTLKQTYLPRMYSGKWSGAMDLTEPHCGTDLGLIKTKAVPRDDGSFEISGTKIFITWGDHDMAENIIHLVLAKLPDAPNGTKGISLFLVPKFVPDNNGEISEQNGLSCGSLEKKMGIKGSATCVMNYDNAQGWLVGEPHKGLSCMFTMMNYERLVVGIQGLGVADASYQTAAAYARERLQGRSLLGVKNPSDAADSILVHPDVRRMLMTMLAYNQAGRAFYLYTSQYLDIVKYSSDTERIGKAENMVALLTPVVKAFLTDISFDMTVLGQQVLGGHGYIREWGQEQHVRDARIAQIYEGTNGIQAMDLIGRKVVGSNGKLIEGLISEINQFISKEAADKSLAGYKTKLVESLDDLNEVTEFIINSSKADPSLPGSAAVEYQNLLGHVLYGYMWLRMMVPLHNNADSEFTEKFTQSKIALADFYFSRLLPRVSSLKFAILSGSGSIMKMDEDWF